GDIASLIEKGIISISYYCYEDSDEILPVYSLEPLFEKVSEFWACEKVSVYQKIRKTLKKQETENKNSKNNQAVFSTVCKAFEKEFARLLSPMEIEQINLWVNDFNGNTELILEALKRAVMLGKHNFKYIDIILLEWHKNNLNTISEVLSFEANFRERQAQRGIRRKSSEQSVNKKDKFRLLYLG
ncbi:MAG TPA: DnaD domain protein, partial [Desulfobacteria bacterium]|nr:DnaD domain protein [Desulfobacteria bacterium]